MRVFLEEFGSAIFLIAIVGVLLLLKSPLGNTMTKSITEAIDNMAAKYGVI